MSYDLRNCAVSNDLERPWGHSPIASLFKCNSSNVHAASDKMSTDGALRCPSATAVLLVLALASVFCVISSRSWLQSYHRSCDIFDGFVVYVRKMHRRRCHHRSRFARNAGWCLKHLVRSIYCWISTNKPLIVTVWMLFCITNTCCRKWGRAFVLYLIIDM